MKKLIILSLFCCLASSLLLHSQAVKVVSNNTVRFGVDHTLTFGPGETLPNGVMFLAVERWDWGLKHTGDGLNFAKRLFAGQSYPPPQGTVWHQYDVSSLFLSDNCNVGIGKTNPQYKLDVNGIIHANDVVTVSSDKRLKKDISPLFTNSYDLNKLNSITYKRNYLESEQEQILNKDKDTNTHYGFIAQELREIYPELVFEDREGYLSVNYIGMIPVLVNAIKELRAEIDVLKGNSFVKSNTTEVTLSAKLYQNNPNPFSERTEIKYYIPSIAVNATLCVYDLNGSQILKMDIAGRENGSISINANQLKAGMYLYALLVDGREVDTKKMILTGE